MRIALNSYFLTIPRTGTGRYARQLLSGLDSHRDIDLLVLPAPAHDVGGSKTSRGIQLIAKLFNEQYGDLVRARRLGADLVHFPYFAGPAVALTRFVTTIHDLVPLKWPEYSPTPLAKLYFLVTRVGARNAARIVTDSQSSAYEITSTLGISEEKIKVVPLAADPIFFEPITVEETSIILNRFDLKPGGYFFYAGSFDRRKNLGRLVVAYALLATRRQDTIPLVLAGHVPTPNRTIADVKAIVRRCGIAARVRFVGSVPDRELRVLYNQARAVIWPSLYEGFGLPPLEAMAAGAAVAVANQSSSPEVAGNAALLFDPNDPLPISIALERLQEDDRLVEELRIAGRDRAGQFSWQRTLAGTHAVYREALG